MKQGGFIKQGASQFFFLLLNVISVGNAKCGGHYICVFFSFFPHWFSMIENTCDDCLSVLSMGSCLEPAMWYGTETQSNATKVRYWCSLFFCILFPCYHVLLSRVLFLLRRMCKPVLCIRGGRESVDGTEGHCSVVRKVCWMM